MSGIHDRSPYISNPKYPTIFRASWLPAMANTINGIIVTNIPWQCLAALAQLYLCSHNKPPKSNWSSSASPSLLEEVEFRAALDEFASAEFRLGK